MGYTLELWDVPVERLLRELRSPLLSPDDIAAPTDERIVERWDPLAQSVVASLAQGGAELGGDQALYVAAVIRTLGEHLESLDHTSSGGEQFRDVLAGPAAGRLGVVLADQLLGRSLAGLTWVDYPAVGWVSGAELRARALDLTAPGEDEDPFELLFTLQSVVQQAARRESDIVSVYL